MSVPIPIYLSHAPRHRLSTMAFSSCLYTRVVIFHECFDSIEVILHLQRCFVARIHILSARPPKYSPIILSAFTIRVAESVEVDYLLVFTHNSERCALMGSGKLSRIKKNNQKRTIFDTTTKLSLLASIDCFFFIPQ
jgi:hypothetical protein